MLRLDCVSVKMWHTKINLLPDYRMNTHESRILHDFRSIQWDHTFLFNFFILFFLLASNSLCVSFEVLAPWRFKIEYTIFAFNRRFTFSSTFRWTWFREWTFFIANNNSHLKSCSHPLVAQQCELYSP